MLYIGLMMMLPLLLPPTVVEVAGLCSSGVNNLRSASFALLRSLAASTWIQRMTCAAIDIKKSPNPESQKAGIAKKGEAPDVLRGLT